MIGRTIICCLLFSLNAAAQEQETTDSVSTQTTKTTVVDRLRQVQNFLDIKAQKKVDPNYIEVPDKPWRLILRYKESMFDVDYNNSAGDLVEGYTADWQLHFEPPASASVGVWAGYRGVGFAISQSLKKKEGTTFSFGMTGAKYGANFRLRSFEVDETTLTATVYENDNAFHQNGKERLGAPIKITSLYLNGYYVFNGRRYSQAAAYNQSVIQRHSAGSFLAGATWYMSTLNFSEPRHVPIILLSQNIGRIKIHQGNIGVGYGYNWVPMRGLVVNAMAMPTASFYNRVKVYEYDCNYKVDISEGPDDYGEWNAETRTWANGKTYKPIPSDDEEWKWVYTADCWETGSESDYSMLRINLDLRIGIAYNWKRYFIGIQGQYNNFHFKKDPCKVNLFDAYARTSLGIRL